MAVNEVAEPVKRINWTEGNCRLPWQGEGQAKLLKNARPLLTGGVRVRYGQELKYSVGADATIGSITDIYTYYSKANGLHVYSLRRTNDGDKFFDGETEITGPTLVGAKYTSIIEYKDTIFITNGDTGEIQYHVPGSSTRASIVEAGGGTLPRGMFMRAYKDRLYVLTNDGTIRYTNAGGWSSLPDVEFSDNNFQQVRETSVEGTGMAVGENIMSFHTKDSFSIMAGTPGNEGYTNTYSIEEFYGHGLVASRTLTAKSRFIAWMTTENRPVMMEGALPPEDLDEAGFVEEFFQASNYPRAASAAFLGRELWFSLPVGNTPNERRVLVYDLFRKRWIAVFTGLEGYAISYCPELNVVYLGSHTGGYIWQQAYGSFKPIADAGSLIPFELQDAQILVGDPWHKKVIGNILVASNIRYSESLNYSYAIEETDNYTAFEVNSTATEDTHNWGDDLWGAENWDTDGLKVRSLRAFEDRLLEAHSLRLKVAGNLSGGDILYGFRIPVASMAPRVGESTFE